MYEPGILAVLDKVSVRLAEAEALTGIHRKLIRARADHGELKVH